MLNLNMNEYYSYQTLIDSMELEEILSEHDNNYQGDSYYLFRRGEEYGMLVFGWGSCSGCDALEAAYGDEASTTQLRDDLYASIKWMSHTELCKYVIDKQWDLEWYYYDDGGERFITKLRDFVVS